MFESVSQPLEVPDVEVLDVEVPDANNNDVIIEMQAPQADQGQVDESDQDDEGFSEEMDECNNDDILYNIFNNNNDDDDNNNANNIIHDNNNINDNRPTQDDIDAWMTPKRAREKELLLLAQYRRCQNLTRQRNHQLEAQKKQREKMAKLSTKFKRQTLRVKGLEKIIRDILNVN